MTKLNSAFLANKGLNLQAVFSLDSLPTAISEQLKAYVVDIERYSQLVVLGNAGPKFWSELSRVKTDSANPVDDYSSQLVSQYFGETLGEDNFQLLFPGDAPIGLQSLGELAGWHHPSPFRIGINQRWGSWFAYRAVILCRSQFTLTPREASAQPCNSCEDKPCISACPANALAGGDLSLERCHSYRMEENTLCGDRCLARMACPVGRAEQYPLAQIQYHYTESLGHLKKH